MFFLPIRDTSKLQTLVQQEEAMPPTACILCTIQFIFFFQLQQWAHSWCSCQIFSSARNLLSFFSFSNAIKINWANLQPTFYYLIFLPNILFNHTWPVTMFCSQQHNSKKVILLKNLRLPHFHLGTVNFQLPLWRLVDRISQ